MRARSRFFAGLTLLLSNAVSAQEQATNSPQDRPLNHDASIFVKLRDLEQANLLRREYTGNAIGGGAFLALFAGFGSGQAMQGRWRESGWVYTLAHGVATILWASALFVAVGQDHDNDWCLGLNEECPPPEHSVSAADVLLVTGITLDLALRVAQMVDAIVVPRTRNRRGRALRQQLGLRPRFGASPIFSGVGGDSRLTGAAGSVSLGF